MGVIFVCMFIIDIWLVVREFLLVTLVAVVAKFKGIRSVGVLFIGFFI